MSRVLVTGGAGFIGSHLVERLLADGHEVVNVDNFDEFYPRAFKEANLAGNRHQPRYSFAELDVRDTDRLRSIWASHPFDVVCHLAARAGVRPSLPYPALYWDINTRGTLSMLELAREFKPTAFIFASSSSVYGDASPIPFTEDDSADRPVSPYAATKRAGELMCHTYHHLYGLNITCLRFFTVYGPRNRPDLAVAKFTGLIEAGKPVPLFGDGTSRRDYTYIDDIIDGVVAAIDRCEGYHVYNLGHSEPVELRELLRTIERVLGKKAVVEYHPWQAGDVMVTCANIAKAQQDLGFSPSTPIEIGIERYVRWYADSAILRGRVQDSPLAVTHSERLPFCAGNRCPL